MVRIEELGEDGEVIRMAVIGEESALIEAEGLVARASPYGAVLSGIYETGKYIYGHRHELKRTVHNLETIAKSTGQGRSKRIHIEKPPEETKSDPPESEEPHRSGTPKNNGMVVIRTGGGGHRVEPGSHRRRRKRRPKSEIGKLKKKVALLMKDHGSKSYYLSRKFTPFVCSSVDMAGLGGFNVDNSRAAYFHVPPAFTATTLETELVKGKAQDGSPWPVGSLNGMIKDLKLSSVLHFKNNNTSSCHLQVVKYKAIDVGTVDVLTELQKTAIDRGFTGLTVGAGVAATNLRAELYPSLFSGGIDRHDDFLSRVNDTVSYRTASKVMKFTLAPGESIDISGKEIFNYEPEDLDNAPLATIFEWNFGFLFKVEGEIGSSNGTPAAVGFADYNVVGMQTDYLSWQLDNELGENITFSQGVSYPTITDFRSVKNNVEKEAD